MPTASERRFYTTKPREALYETIELYNANIGTLRYVARSYFPLQFGLEASAPRNPGQEVVFQPANMGIAQSTQEDQPTATLEVQLGTVGQTVKPLLKQLKGQVDQRVELIYRAYRGNQLNEPMNAPQMLYVESINFSADAVSLVASDDSPMSVIVARKYLPQDFPGLEVQI